MDNAQHTLGERHLKYWQGWEYRGEYVYVLEAPPLTPVKVGFTRDLVARISALQTGCPYPLRVKYVIPALQTLETWLHQHMRASRLGGEWFDGADMPKHLENIAAMAEEMVETHEPGERPNIPNYADYAKWIPYRIRRPAIHRSQRTTYVSRFVEPDPVSPEEAEERLRAEWLRPTPAREKGYAPKRW